MAKQTTVSGEGGYALIVIMALVAILVSVVAGSLHTTAASARMVHANNERAQLFYETEEGIAHSLSWLRVNSQKLVTPFRRDEFYTRFERTDPTVGSNDTSLFTVPTKIKLAGTTDSAILVNDNALASATFAATRDLTTNIAFDAAGNYASATLGNAKLRITLIDAVADDPTKDWGPPPAPTPETDFYPVYRIDAMTELDSGAHTYSVVVGRLIHLFDYGIYGQDHLELRQECDSYISSAGPYSNASKRANCPAASNSTSQVHKSEKIYGSLQTNGDIVEESPFGGQVCADFQSGCPNPGEKCAGEDCGVPLLESYYPWATYCPTDQGDVTFAASTTLSVAGPDPSQKCWGTLTVNAGVTVTLDSTTEPYFIKTLDLKNNSNSKININPSVAGGTVEIYVEKIVGDMFNGNQTLNTAGRPVQFRLYYLGTDDLTLNGNADMNVALVAPNAKVTVSGNFDFNGGLLAKELLLTGSGGVHYDESLQGGGKVSDSQYRNRQVAQHYW